MTNWPTQPYDIVAAGKELGLSPKREATQWCKISAGPKDSPSEAGITASVKMPRRERLQEQLEREARESRESKPEAIADKLIESAAAQLGGGWISGSVTPELQGCYECEMSWIPLETAALKWDGTKWLHGRFMGSPGAGDVFYEPLTASQWVLRYRVIQPNLEDRNYVPIIDYRSILPKQEGKA